MEVLVGPTFTIDVPSPPAYVVPPARPPQDKHQMVVAPASLFSEEEEAAGSPERVLIPRGIGSGSSEEENSSESSSSIGAPDESEEEEDEDSNVVSSSKAGLGSLESLEDSLPIKRGLSNHFCGKSKSFVNLSDMSSVGSAKDLEKPENPFNKRRRILMANKWSKRSSFYSWHNPKSMPLLALNEDEQEENEDNQGPDEESPSSSSSSPPHRHPGEEKEKLFLSPKAQGRNFKFNNASFKSHSCFSLADLEHQ